MNRLTYLLLPIVFASAIAVVTVRHDNRLQFIALQKMENQRDELQTEWGRLMLERATWAAGHNIVMDATKRLHMSPPPPEKIITVQLGVMN